MKGEAPSILDSPTYTRHAMRLAASYNYWTGETLLPPDTAPERLARALFFADFAIVSHGIGDDPIFNFGNQIALGLFEMDWKAFTQLPSRCSAEPGASPEREALMSRVSREGCVRGYRGIRVSASGRRFVIADASIWEVVDREGRNHGRAARFNRWWPVASPPTTSPNLPP